MTPYIYREYREKEGKKGSRSYGIGFLNLLALLFIALKLTNHIDWSWWWILSPLWIPLALAIALIAIVGSIALLVVLFSK
jgi:hypothetical protein